eukprot:g2222.t1
MKENMEIQAKKAHWGDADKAHTRWLIEEAIRKEQEQEAFERAEKERKSKEARDYQRQLEEQMIKEAQDESELERLRLEDQEKAWSKRERQWAAERAARDALMKEVFETRSLQIKEKSELSKIEKETDKMYAEMARQKYEQDYSVEKAKEEERRKRLMDAQEQLLDQIRANEEQRERERQQQYFAQRSMRKQEELFNEQLAAMRADEYKPKDFRKKSAKWFS